MTDQPAPARTCVICQRRPYERAQVCEPCRGRLAWQPREILRLWTQLLDSEPEPDGWAALGDVSRRLGKWTHDPVTDALPAGPTRTTASEPISGSREPCLPVSVDRVDLTLPARSGAVRDPYGDQTGHNPVASSLDEWARDWRDVRNLRERLPVPTVPALTHWLAERVEWACDHHPAVDEYAGEMTRLIGVLRAVLGLNEPRPVLCEGVACPRCERRTLYRNGEYVECAGCGRLYRENEYRAALGEQVREVKAAA